MQRSHIFHCVAVFLICGLISFAISTLVINPSPRRDCTNLTFNECKDGCECFRCDNACFPQNLYNETTCLTIKTEIYTTKCFYEDKFLANILLYCFIGFALLSLIILPLLVAWSNKKNYTINETKTENVVV